jgi:hypothetical protein
LTLIKIYKEKEFSKKRKKKKKKEEKRKKIGLRGPTWACCNRPYGRTSDTRGAATASQHRRAPPSQPETKEKKTFKRLHACPKASPSLHSSTLMKRRGSKRRHQNKRWIEPRTKEKKKKKEQRNKKKKKKTKKKKLQEHQSHLQRYPEKRKAFPHNCSLLVLIVGTLIEKPAVFERKRGRKGEVLGRSLQALRKVRFRYVFTKEEGSGQGKTCKVAWRLCPLLGLSRKLDQLVEGYQAGFCTH